jgi:hypothetical protein
MASPCSLAHFGFGCGRATTRGRPLGRVDAMASFPFTMNNPQVRRGSEALQVAARNFDDVWRIANQICDRYIEEEREIEEEAAA